MAGRSNESLIGRIAQQTNPESWFALLAPLGAVTVGAALYHQHMKNMGEDDLFPGYKETLATMIDAQKHPEHLFYPLPPRRLRSSLMSETFQKIGELKETPYSAYPLLAAWEWSLGRVHLQLAIVENHGRIIKPGTERIRLAALVGDDNALHKIEARNSHEARPQVERILRLHSPGRRLLNAVDRGVPREP